MTKILNPVVLKKFESYPPDARKALLQLRDYIYDIAKENALDKQLEECIKWGQPSYLVPKGSTLRIDQLNSEPNNVAIFFNCKSKLVETIKEIYSDVFLYIDNRAILININKEIPVKELKHCIKLALTYHKIKHLPLLGA